MSRRWGEWDNYEPSRPKPTKEGIKAKSQRGNIGETWWSTRFIKLLQSFGMGPRLSRGKSYARSGQVLPLSITPGLVAAKVQGSRPTPYKVEIRLNPLNDTDWARALEAMSEQAIFMAKLLAGEMPPDIEEAFATAKVPLFPMSIKDLVTDCSCPDWANPCKHVAAVFFILAEAFDGDPFLIFALRGRTRTEVIDQLRKMRSDPAEEESQDIEIAAVEQTGPLPLSLRLGHFWSAGESLSEVHTSPVAAETPDAIIRQLGPLPPEIRAGELLESLRQAYTEIVRRSAEMNDEIKDA